jgi:hypothetical protein
MRKMHLNMRQVAFMTILFGIAIPSFAQSTLVKSKNIVVTAYPASPMEQDVTTLLATLETNKSLSSSDPILKTVETLLSSDTKDEQGDSNDAHGEICSNFERAYIFHVARWRVNNDASYALVLSHWYVYHTRKKTVNISNKPKTCTLERSKTKWSTGRPLLYGDHSALLIGITEFEKEPVSVERIQLSYKISVTPAIPENITDLGTAISALLQIPAAGGGPVANPAAAEVAGPLTFTKQPTNVAVGNAIKPAVAVSILNASGIVDNTANNAVTIGLGNNPSGGRLSGTTTVNAVAGVATFSDLSIDTIGVGYTLTASAGGLPSATSNSFNVTTGPVLTTYFNTYISVAGIATRKRLPLDFNITYGLTQNSQDASMPGQQKLPDAYINVPYQAQIWVKNNDGSYRFAGSNPLPPGLTLDPKNGSIRGTPRIPDSKDPPRDTSCDAATDSQAAVDTATAAAKKAKMSAPAITEAKTYCTDFTVTKDGAVATLHAYINISALPAAKNSTQSGNTQGKATGAASSKPGAAVQGSQTGAQNNTNGSQQSSTVPTVDCSATSPDTPCSFSSTLRSDDHEYWDVSLGITIPGVREAIYSTPSGSKTPTLPPSITTHTNALALIDVYPFAHWVNKESWKSLHLNFAFPIASQTLHRPGFGLAENITTIPWLADKNFPRISVFADIVYMKQTIAVPPSNPRSFPTDRAWKMMYGVEVPITAITNAIGKAAKGASKGTGSGGGT